MVFMSLISKEIKEIKIIMGPITNYELGKARHRELEAEFERYRRYQIDLSAGQRWPKIQRLNLKISGIRQNVFVTGRSIFAAVRELGKVPGILSKLTK